MPQFAEQLIAARKAKSMTQEKLAQAVNISRSRVSRWETGETVPDVDMIRKLSEVLEFDFLSGGKHEEAQAAEPEAHVEAPVEADVPQEAATEAVPAVKSPVKKYWPLAAVAGVLLLAILLVVIQPGKQQPMETYEPYTWEWYRQEQTAVSGQAHVVVASQENPVKAIRFADFDGGVGWLYTIRYEEVNGVPFTVTKITQTVFNARGQDDMVFEGDELVQIMGDTTLSKDRGMPCEFGGGFPLQSVKGIGLAVEGVDAKGNELVFRGYVELSQEIAE